MNIWLLGNGFDLAHTLPTKYENFIHTMEFLINHDGEKFNTIGEIFGNKELQDKDPFIKDSYEKYSEAYNKSTMDIWYNSLELRELDFKSNYWLKYFIKSFNKDLGWIDFEKEISNVVDEFKDFLNNFEEFLDKKDYSAKERKHNAFRISTDSLFFFFLILNSEQRHIIESFDFFYTKDQNSNIGIIKKEYLLKRTYDMVIKNEEIAYDLYSSLRDFTFILCLYLWTFVESIFDSNIISTAFENLKNADHIISFNYTQTVKNIYGKESVKHIHGSDVNFEDSIVLGINSDEDDSVDSVDTLFLNFKKYFQRVRYNTDVDYLKAIDEIKAKKSEYGTEKVLLTVVGHSLDVTDEDIIKELFDLADEIVIHYHNPNAIGSYIKNLVNLYGREGFDNLRKNKHLVFENITNENLYSKHKDKKDNFVAEVV